MRIPCCALGYKHSHFFCYLLYRKESGMERNGNNSLPSERFEAMYRKSIDPWEYETSAYEQEKYQNTLAVLPQQRYQKAFEIGCSIGVLTKQLSLYCDELLAVDCSLSALQHA